MVVCMLNLLSFAFEDDVILVSFYKRNRISVCLSVLKDLANSWTNTVFLKMQHLIGPGNFITICGGVSPPSPRKKFYVRGFLFLFETKIKKMPLLPHHHFQASRGVADSMFKSTKLLLLFYTQGRQVIKPIKSMHYFNCVSPFFRSTATSPFLNSIG